MHLTAAHWVYLAGVVVMIMTMVMRKNIVVPAVIATFLTAIVYTHSMITGITSVFNASLVAAQNLFNIFLIIALVTAMLHALQGIGADQKMVVPFRRIIRNGHLAFWTLVVATYFISLFFWPTPAVPLIGAVLVPVAIRSGLRPLGIGMAVACAGQGMALSSDYVMRVAPGLSAKAAGVDANVVADKAMVLSLVIGGVSLLVGYLMEIRHMRRSSPNLLKEWESSAQNKADAYEAGEPGNDASVGQELLSVDGDIRPAEQRELVPASSVGAQSPEIPDSSAGAPTIGHGVALTTENKTAESSNGAIPDDAAARHPKSSRFFAVFVPLSYLSLIIYMILATSMPSVPALDSGDAAALVGGVAALTVFLVSLVGDGKRFLETSAEHVVDGLVFAFKAMGIVLPIAGFFFIGNGEFSADIIGSADSGKGPSFLFDLVTAAQQHIPHNAFIATFGILLIGMVAGLEGSGFSGLPLTGSLAGSLGAASGISATSLAAVGQMGNIWSGGGTLVAWSSLIAVAGFARVPVIDLARHCFLPVCCGLVAGVAVAVFFLG